MLEMRKDIFADERDDNLNVIGKGLQRQDMPGHVTGRTRYFDDHAFDGMLHLKVVRSPHAHARIRSIDIAAAQRAPGVKRVLRGADVPVNKNTLLSLINFGKDDEPSLAVDKVSYKGEPVVAIIADSEAAALAARQLVRIDYDLLPNVFDVEEALKPGAPVVNETYPGNYFEYHQRYDHQKLRFGDVEKAFAQADMVLEHRYQMSPIEHAPTETNGSIAAPEQNGRFVVHSCAQGLFFALGTAAKIVDVESNRLHFIGGTVGGGFGGKVDALTEPLAVLGAMLTGKPVRFVLDREEEMLYGSPRGAERIYVKDGLMRDGRIVARSIRSYFDAGAYTRLSSYAAIKCTAHLPGPYWIPNVASDVYVAYTNRCPSTAMRGFGVTAVDFALEVQMDRLAEAANLDPMEFRVLNAYRDGDMKAHRRVAKNTALIECVQVVAEKANWPLSEQAKRQSSLTGGVGERALIPATPLDQRGQIGRPDTRNAPSSQVLPAGTARIPLSKQPVMEGDRDGRAKPTQVPRYESAQPIAALPPYQPAQTSNPPAPAYQPPPAYQPSPPPPAPPPAAPAQTQHGAVRFSSVFGTRRR
ncbi:xanthine dehydrogenase family protein molybdopterin-binding subunit [Bosea caraganae]|uniref:Xanthine dehydrogenase family protein molybdopterin-binding subunit n=1 Tax=Bosea caraganae TaxID=2763117 RepID=A0A370L5I6_9HYPH|nr:molybdopterin cofactor-binding domain-containing protein [Bosea caraganae]RDJ23346.1 xanthine dehydrogenase family protein molybdopterin-binding subunit [Bosea caraganae]RDJ24542.1 xanthine dehydrogenase family protein molybdopterin-binding subunit [Bosea caraganae]